MFNINDLVVYGTSGICKITDIVDNAPYLPKGIEKYYVLQQLSIENSVIYVPVESNKIPMRKILTESQARNLLDTLPNIQCLKIENDKHRELEYKNIIKTTDCIKLAGMMKMLYERNKNKSDSGKKVNDTDNKYFKIARQKLFSEIAISLGKSEDEIESYIKKKLSI